MADSTFNPKDQHTNVPNKIVVGLERIANAYRVLLWEHAKKVGHSPIQIQLLIFIAYHAKNLCTVGNLANEFNLTKPTISDALKALEKKELITRVTAKNDGRSHHIELSGLGRKAVKEAEHFSDPIKNLLENIPSEEQGVMLNNIIGLIANLNRSGVVNVQRTCLLCRFHESIGTGHFCNLLKEPLAPAELRLDCPEFEAAS